MSLPSSGDKKAESGLWQKTLFTNYYVHLCDTDSFGIALGQFAGGTTPLQRVLEETLLVQTSFHRMLVAREYSFLLANVPDNAGELVVSVGGGAAKLVRECAGKEYAENRTYTQQVLPPDLRALHAAVSVDLDKRLVDAVAREVGCSTTPSTLAARSASSTMRNCCQLSVRAQSVRGLWERLLTKGRRFAADASALALRVGSAGAFLASHQSPVTPSYMTHNTQKMVSIKNKTHAHTHACTCTDSSLLNICS